jgi:hypothetical protein
MLRRGGAGGANTELAGGAKASGEAAARTGAAGSGDDGGLASAPIQASTFASASRSAAEKAGAGPSGCADGEDTGDGDAGSDGVTFALAATSGRTPDRVDGDAGAACGDEVRTTVSARTDGTLGEATVAVAGASGASIVATGLRTSGGVTRGALVVCSLRARGASAELARGIAGCGAAGAAGAAAKRATSTRSDAR